MTIHRAYVGLVLPTLLFSGCIDSGIQDDGTRAAETLDDDALKHDESPGVAYGGVPAPDLVVAMVSSPSSATVGETFVTADTVTNQGTADAAASYTKYYLSSNGVTPVYLIGNRSVAAIPTGDSNAGTAMLTIPAGVAQATYRLLACADSGPGTSGRISQVAESNERNNCTAAAGTIAITGADLRETNVSATLTPAGALTVFDTVDNIGTVGAGASITRWYLSSDNIRGNDAFIRNCTDGGPIPGRNIGTLGANASSAGQASTPSLCVRDADGLHPPASGTYFVIACADDTRQVPELSEANNCTASSNTIQVTVQIGGADLSQTVVTDPSATGMLGTTFSITDTVRNVGGNAAPSSFTKFYLSTNGTSLNWYLNTRSVDALSANATSTATTTMTILAGTPAGTYRVIACADSGPGTAGRTSQIAEPNEANNCRASAGTISIGASPDLVIEEISDPPPTGSRGGMFAIMDTTTNTGAADAGTFHNKYYLTSDGDTPVYLLAPGAAAGPLTSGASQSVSANATIPSNTVLGTYWILACADAGPGTAGRSSAVVEIDERNNCTRSAAAITVQ